ncbi:copper resistance protein CopC [Peribacillus butanolivorans]|uniref:copper resistance CopC family protein n=1 Tax=Peribacillus butanolivorans TaxID=421767 RepID=UPI0036D98DF5
MIKKLFLFTFIFFLAFVNNALAHTGLESSSPQNGAIVKEELQEITLTFESKIEQNSTFEIQNLNGDSIPVKNISITENKMVGSFSNPLENGKYQAKWKIIGADGHPIDGDFSFSVDMPVTETPAEVQKEPKKEDAKQVEENKPKTANEPKEEIEQNKLPSYIIPSIIGVLIVIVVGSFIWILRRKK